MANKVLVEGFIGGVGDIHYIIFRIKIGEQSFESDEFHTTWKLNKRSVLKILFKRRIPIIMPTVRTKDLDQVTGIRKLTFEINPMRVYGNFSYRILGLLNAIRDENQGR